MGEDVSDRSLLDVSGLSLRDPLDESALARALKRILATSAEGPSNSFTANILKRSPTDRPTARQVA